ERIARRSQRFLERRADRRDPRALNVTHWCRNRHRCRPERCASAGTLWHWRRARRASPITVSITSTHSALKRRGFGNRDGAGMVIAETTAPQAVGWPPLGSEAAGAALHSPNEDHMTHAHRRKKLSSKKALRSFSAVAVL